ASPHKRALGRVRKGPRNHDSGQRGCKAGDRSDSKTAQRLQHDFSTQKRTFPPLIGGSRLRVPARMRARRIWVMETNAPSALSRCKQLNIAFMSCRAKSKCSTG